MRAVLLSLAAVCLAVALGLTHGTLGLRPLALVLAAIAAAAGALRVREAGAGPGGPAALILGAGLTAGVLHDLTQQVGWHATHALMPAFRPTLAAAAALLATHLWPGAPRRLVRARPALLAALWLALVALVLRAAPAPTIDVWDLQQGAAAGLRRGENPYALAYPNRYGPGTALLARDVLSADGTAILAFPYPPLTLAAGLPAHVLLGDVRWAHALLTLLSAGGIWLLGRRSRIAELAGSLVLFQPSGYFLVEQAWTEPVVLACLVGLALAVQRAPASAGVGLAAGLALGAKQYTPLLLLPFLAAVPPARRLRAAAIAAAVAAAIYLPFVLWDPAALWRGLVRFHLSQPFRPDALSLAAAVFRRTGVSLPAWPGFLAAGLVVAAGWRRIRAATEARGVSEADRVSEALGVAALAWLVFLALAKQAFANYYGLAVALCCAAVAAARPADGGASRGTQAP